MSRFLAVTLVLGALGATPSLQAQEQPLHPAKVGITAGTGLRLSTHGPSLLAEDVWAGAIVHVTPAVALRPGLVFFKLDEEDEDVLVPASSSSSDEGGVGFGLGAFYFLRARGNLLLYLGPEAKYYFEAAIELYDNGDKESEQYEHRFTGALLMGAQYMLSDRFGFCADLGLGILTSSERYKRWNALGTLVEETEDRLTSFYMRPAYLGAVFYFN